MLHQTHFKSQRCPTCSTSSSCYVATDSYCRLHIHKLAMDKMTHL